MGQNRRSNNAATRDAQTLLGMEECASRMGQKTHANYATMKDAQIKLKEEECASGMGQKSNNAPMKDAQIKLKMEECASSMGRRDGSNYAARKDARNMLPVKDFVVSTEERSNVVRLNALTMLYLEEFA